MLRKVNGHRISYGGIKMDRPVMMGACGLNCGTCEIRLASTDATAAKSVVAWLTRWAGWNRKRALKTPKRGKCFVPDAWVIKQLTGIAAVGY